MNPREVPSTETRRDILANCMEKSVVLRPDGHRYRNAKYTPHDPESKNFFTEKWLRDLIKIQELKEAEKRTEIGARRAFKDMANGIVPRLISDTIVTKSRAQYRRSENEYGMSPVGAPAPTIHMGQVL